MKDYQYIYSTLELQKVFNQVKDIVIQQLENDNLLKDSAENIGSTYCLCINKKGLFGKFVDKLLGNNSETDLTIIILKTK